MGVGSSADARVGIVTIQDDGNYGNRLQNFALQEALRMLGWQVESIRNTPAPMSRRLLASRAVHALRSSGPLDFGKRNGALLLGKFKRTEPPQGPHFGELRRAAIAKFADERLLRSESEFASRPMADWAARYRHAVVGSDQVWNHGFRNAHEIDFLTFMLDGQRIAYAASFGVSEIPAFLRDRYRSWLTAIPQISVREDQGALIVRDLIGRDVPVVLDPTLLLGVDRWSQEFERPEGLTDSDPPYAVQFFLGAATPEQRNWVAALAQERGVRVVDLNDLGSDEFAGLGPLGFAGALGHAQFVATDSFHAGVFSLLQHTPLVLRSRDQTDSRLHTLLDKHGVQRTATEVAGLTTALTPDWNKADALIDEERATSWEFLRSALGEPPSRVSR